MEQVDFFQEHIHYGEISGKCNERFVKNNIFKKKIRQTEKNLICEKNQKL